MSKEKRILFTGVGRRIELIQAYRQASLSLGIPVIIYGADVTGTASALAYCDFTRRVCGMREAGYIDELLAVCQKDGIDIVIPTIDTDLMILSQNKGRFEEIGTKVLVASPDKISICRDKTRTSEFFVECGLKAPMPVSNWEEYCGGYPAFIKPKDGSSSINAYKVKDVKELEVYAGQIDGYIVQPFIDGKEYTIDIFSDFNGNLLSVVPRERLKVRAGEVLITKIFIDEKMVSEVEMLCRKFKPCGPMTVQLIRDSATGDDYFIEINPRYGGGSPLSMKAGARSAEALLLMLDGRNPGFYTRIEDGAIYSRFDQSVCIKRGTTSQKVQGVIFDLDDTLYSEKEYVRSGFKAVAEYLGNTEYESKLWKYFELGKSAIDELLSELGRESEKDKALSVYRSNKPVLHLYDGAIEAISDLKAAGLKVGIITDGRPEGQRNKIAALGLDKVIDDMDIIITDELGGTQFRKPCDIAFRIMQRRWKLPFEEIVYIGDNLIKDFQAVRQLGMKSIHCINEDGLYFGSDIMEEALGKEIKTSDLKNLFEILLK